MTRKRGRPKGTNQYSDTLFLQFIKRAAKTPEQVRREITEKFNLTISWNTIQNYLDRLAKDGQIQKRRVGNYHVYFRRETL